MQDKNYSENFVKIKNLPKYYSGNLPAYRQWPSYHIHQNDNFELRHIQKVNELRCTECKATL